MSNLNLKEWINQIMTWVRGPVVSFATKVTTECGYVAYNTAENIRVTFGIGSGGITHGVWSNTLGKWIIHADKSAVYLNGNINVTSQTANKVLASPNGSTGQPNFRALVANDIPSLASSKITGLGGLATKSVVTAPVTIKEGQVNSSAIAANTSVTITVTIDIPADTQVVGVVCVSIANNAGKSGSGNIVLRGFDVNGFTIGGTQTINTFWRNISSTAYSASQFHVTVQIACMKCRNIS